MSQFTADESVPLSSPALGASAGSLPVTRRGRRVVILAVAVAIVVLAGGLTVGWFVTRSGSGCGDEAVRVPADASAAPYTYRVPKCFVLADNETTWDFGFASTPLLNTAVVPVGGAPTEIIRVIADRSMRDRSVDTDAEVEDGLELSSSIAGTVEGPLLRRNIDGARGWGRMLTLRDGGYSMAWMFLKGGEGGSLVINVLCRWTQDAAKAEILAGCDQILDSLTIA